MHDLDLAQTRFEFGADESETDGTGFEFSDTESFSAMGEALFDEVEEMELAGQLLEITDEAELDQFLGDFLKKA